VPQHPLEQELTSGAAPDILAGLAEFIERSNDGDTLEPTVDTQALLLEIEHDSEPSTWLIEETLDRGMQACSALRQLGNLAQMVGPHEAIDAAAWLHASTVRRVATRAATLGVDKEQAGEIFELAAWLEDSAAQNPMSLAAAQGEWALAQPTSIVEPAEKRVDRTTACVEQLEALRTSGNLPSFLPARAL